jgi:hypothetical protein
MTLAEPTVRNMRRAPEESAGCAGRAFPGRGLPGLVTARIPDFRREPFDARVNAAPPEQHEPGTFHQNLRAGEHKKDEFDGRERFEQRAVDDEVGDDGQAEPVHDGQIGQEK